jgi:hypothetical protein
MQFLFLLMIRECILLQPFKRFFYVALAHKAVDQQQFSIFARDYRFSSFRSEEL